MEHAARPLLKLYGSTLVREFGPLALKAVRQHMIEVEDLCRQVTNSRVNRIKRIIKWAVSEELAPPGAYEALRAVSGLRYGRSVAQAKPSTGQTGALRYSFRIGERSPTRSKRRTASGSRTRRNKVASRR